MASADTAAPGRQPPPPNLTLGGLSSNNPFRNRLSQQPSSPRSMEHQYATPTSATNPFLDASEPTNKGTMSNGNNPEVDDIFKDLSVSDKDKPAVSNAPPTQRTVPPSQSGAPLPNRRPLGPDERRDRPPYGPPRGPNSPQKRPTEHRRRVSDSSMMEFDRQGRRDRQIDRGDRPARTESEERKRRERRREREERHAKEKERLANGGKPRKGQRNLDLIDKLDVTGVYGQGLFHHDGPFDACRPARNAKKDYRAPMQAFPEGSMNMAIGGAGPNRSRLDLDKFHGRTEEGFTDYSATRKTPAQYQEPPRSDRAEQTRYFNSTDRAEQVHGVESYGLGTSTFLEGAPASKSALQRRESEEQTTAFDAGAGGLGRKKSLAQRLRGMSNTRPRTGYAQDGVRSPESRYHGGPVELTDTPLPQQKIMSAGGPSKAVYTKENEVNVFDNEYDQAFDKKGTEIRFAEQEKPNVGRARAPSSPRSNGLTRSVTADAAMASPMEDKPNGGGLLNRMKSLKGGSRKTRPERKESYT